MKERIPLILGLINYLLIFLFPKYLIVGSIVFIASLIFVWAYKTSLFEKIIFTLIPLLYFTIPKIDLSQKITEKYRFANSQKIDFIFPENFKGNAIIITEKNCGQNRILRKGYEKLYIPKDGTLFYKGVIKDYGDEYYFRFFQIKQKDTVEIPGKYIGSSINPIKSEIKVMYVDANLNKNKNLSTILLNLYSTKDKLNYNEKLLEKTYNCN